MKTYEQALQEVNMETEDKIDFLIDLLNSEEITNDIYLKISGDIINEQNKMKGKDIDLIPKPTVHIVKLIESNKKINLCSLDELSPREFVVRKLGIEEGSLSTFCGTGSSGKTMLLQHLAVCVSSGKKLFGKFDVARGSVLHMDEEQTETQTTRRYIRIAAGMDVKELDIQRVVLENRLDSPEILETVQNDLIKLFKGKKLILIDSLKKVSEAEESSPQIEKIMKILKRVAEKAKTTIVLIHHMGKNSGGGVKQSGRGHSSIYDSTDNQMDIFYDQEKEICTMKTAKSRDKCQFGKLTFKFKDAGDWNEAQYCSEKIEFEFIEEVSKDKIKAELDIEIKILKMLNDEGTLNQSKIYEFVKGEKKLFNKAMNSLLIKEFINIERGANNAKLITISPEGSNSLAWSEEV